MKRILLFMVVVFCYPSVCKADLFFTFSEAGDGGVIITASGNGTTLSSNPNTDTFSFTFDGDFISASAGAGPFEADSFIGTNNEFFSNPGAANEKMESVDSFSLTNAGANDSLTFETSGNLNFNNGAGYSLEFTAVIEESELDFDDLNFGNFSVNAGAFGNANVSFAAVPEPASMTMLSLLAIGGGGFVWRKRRKAKAELIEDETSEEKV